MKITVTMATGYMALFKGYTEIWELTVVAATSYTEIFQSIYRNTKVTVTVATGYMGLFEGYTEILN